jgi:hypothetical protein
MQHTLSLHTRVVFWPHPPKHRRRQSRPSSARSEVSTNLWERRCCVDEKEEATELEPRADKGERAFVSSTEAGINADIPVDVPRLEVFAIRSLARWSANSTTFIFCTLGFVLWWRARSHASMAVIPRIVVKTLNQESVVTQCFSSLSKDCLA